MRALLLTVVILFGAIGSVVAQKKNTLIGDASLPELMKPLVRLLSTWKSV